jgi:hypothetical protein
MSTLPEEKLLSAVIVQALEDVCIPPVNISPKGEKKKFILHPDAYSAYTFLFGHGEVYLDLLNIDPQEFKKRIFLQFNDRSTNMPFNVSKRPNALINHRKRTFRQNHKIYTQSRQRWV